MRLPTPPLPGRWRSPAGVCLSGKGTEGPSHLPSLFYKVKASIPSTAPQEGSPGSREKISMVGLSIRGLASCLLRALLAGGQGRKRNTRGPQPHVCSRQHSQVHQETRPLLTLGDTEGSGTHPQVVAGLSENHQLSQMRSIWSQNPRGFLLIFHYENVQTLKTRESSLSSKYPSLSYNNYQLCPSCFIHSFSFFFFFGCGS